MIQIVKPYADQENNNEGHQDIAEEDMISYIEKN